MQNGNQIIQLILGIGVAVFPSIGFLYQYLLIKKRKSVGTFSINVCGVMFLSNLLRIAFYIYKEFSIALLAQSILNIIMQAILLHLCVKTMDSEGYFEKYSASAQDKDLTLLNTLWKWKQIHKYFILVGVEAFVILGLGAIIKRFQITFAGQTLGYVALIAETFLLIPQILQNLKQQRVKGISYTFISLNTFQDLLQLIFVIIYSQPIQFLIFNLMQVITNFLLIIQIMIYKNCFNKPFQNDQQNNMVQHEQIKNEQIPSGHHIVYPVKKPDYQSTKQENVPLTATEGLHLQQKHKKPQSIVVE